MFESGELQKHVQHEDELLQDKIIANGAFTSPAERTYLITTFAASTIHLIENQRFVQNGTKPVPLPTLLEFATAQQGDAGWPRFKKLYFMVNKKVHPDKRKKKKQMRTQLLKGLTLKA